MEENRATPAWLRLRVETRRDGIELIVKLATFLAIRIRRHDDIGDLHCWRLTEKRERLIDCYTQPDDRIACGCFAYRVGHARSPDMRNICDHTGQFVFALFYRGGFT